MADHVLIDRAVVQQALEALQTELMGYDGPVPHIDSAISALRAALAQAEPVQAVATFDEVWAAIDWDKWRLQPIRELVRMIQSKTSPAAPVQQAEPVRDFRLAECVFVGPPPAPHEDWHHAISAMLREKHISGLRISTATADDWNGDKEQQRKPLTIVEIMREWCNANDSVVDFARAIEQAHGIKEAK